MRTEKDPMGTVELPDDALYGAQTARAVKNFIVSDRTAYPIFIHATVLVKKSAAMVHRKLGLLTNEKADAVITAADKILKGEFMDQFVVDVFHYLVYWSSNRCIGCVSSVGYLG